MPDRIEDAEGYSPLTGKIHRHYVLTVEIAVEVDPDYDLTFCTTPNHDNLDREVNYVLHSLVPLWWEGHLEKGGHKFTVPRYRKVVSKTIAGTPV